MGAPKGNSGGADAVTGREGGDADVDTEGRAERRTLGGGAAVVCRVGASGAVSGPPRVPWRWGDACAQSDSILCVLAHGGEPLEVG
jgi:hypothetical protein